MGIRGLGGRDLNDEWAGGARAHLGITVPGFPNMFLVYGPNTNLGGNSIIAMMEAQFGYIRDLVRLLAARPGSYVDVERGAADRFDTEMRDRLGRQRGAGCGAGTARRTAASPPTGPAWSGSTAGARPGRRRSSKTARCSVHAGWGRGRLVTCP